ncbi:heavy-metal-associated domain-containing protein [Mucilaginibacter auburnensis]|uniref:DoxX-like protein n=1 Tax=Mucilaginibacter auburnensis TaxID=1457233 RepID=A0A2H9VM53_9SPHI|nr:heavy metal-associated domain-containing protein [Mucilaginibacter auburnensis]PJJ79383.1 DoxX-like protein [Mucilaginibacter auburnensis]
MKHTYQITGMTCSGCQNKVQQLLGAVPNVTGVSINLPTGETVITMSSHVSTATLKDALKNYPKYQLEEMQEEMPVYIAEVELPKTWLQTYKPILLIFAYISAVAIIVGAHGSGFHWHLAMRVFMAGFFLVFSFFKMLNLDGFADTYVMYDVIARKFKPWAYLYAFIELGLGLAFALNTYPVITNVVTLVVMSVSIIGVLQTVLNKRSIQCACLGAVFNLPMSTVTIIEDGLMIAMSAVALIYL